MKRDNGKVLRWDIFWVDLDKVFPQSSKNHYQKGLRPCIVVSNNKNNIHSDMVQIVPLTTKYDNLPQHRYFYIHDIKNYILPEQITTVEKSILTDKYFTLYEEYFKQVEIAMKIQFGMWKGEHYE